MTKVDAHTIRRIAVAAERGHSTVIAYVRGHTVRPTTAASIERALRELGLEHLRVQRPSTPPGAP